MSVLYSNGSVTHTFGNVACLAMNYIQKFFPEDFFKVVHISTKLAFKQLDIYRSKNKEFWKLHKPILILRPRIEMDDSSKYFYGAAFMNRMHNVTSPAEYANRIQLLRDDQNGVMIQFLWNRYKIYYDVVIIVESYNEQLNTANHIINSIVPNTPFMVSTPLESYVPRCIVEGMSDYLSIDRTDTANIVAYLNTHGEIPFTYKFKDGSGNNEYFALYNTNVEMIPSDLTIDDGAEKNMITDGYTLSFTLSCEFNSIGAFYLMLRDNSDKFVSKMLEMGNDRVVPLYSIPLLFNINLDAGWKIMTAPAYFISSVEEPDVTNIKDSFSTELINILRYQRIMKLPLETFMKVRVFKGDKELIEHVGYDINIEDLDNPTITTYDTDTQATYRLFIIINNLYINNIITEITKFNQEK